MYNITLSYVSAISREELTIFGKRDFEMEVLRGDARISKKGNGVRKKGSPGQVRKPGSGLLKVNI